MRLLPAWSMAKSKPKLNPKKESKQSAKSILAGVRKEMGRPRVAESARNKKRIALTLTKLFSPIPPTPLAIKP
jgi:hypothetical protein